ncbi:unnamed protein product [Amoebophrya sp. A120]|nr:unnamed protein product [Amoebophrya sp. A120]|eukprot:GSA120T00015717001.1
MESVSGRFTDRFQRAIDKLLKDKNLDQTLKHLLRDTILKEVLNKNPKYDSAVTFWEDLDKFFANALKTHAKDAESYRKLQHVKDNVLENLQVKFFTGETLQNLQEQSGEMRAEIIEAWIEDGLDDGGLQSGVKVLANVLSNENVKDNMNREQVQQVIKALEAHADKFPTGVAGIIHTFAGSSTKLDDDDEQEDSEGPRDNEDRNDQSVVASGMKNGSTAASNAKGAKGGMIPGKKGAVGDPKGMKSAGAQLPNAAGIVTGKGGGSHPQAIPVPGQPPGPLNPGQQGFGSQQQGFNMQNGAAQSNQQPRGSPREPDKPLSAEEIARQNLLQLRRDGGQVIKSGDDQFLQKIKKQQSALQQNLWGAQVISYQKAEEQEQKEKEEGKTTAPRPTITIPGITKNATAKVQLRKLKNNGAMKAITLDASKVQKNDLVKCKKILHAKLEENQGMTKAEELSELFRTKALNIGTVNTDCKTIIPVLDPNLVMYAPTTVFLSAPEYLPHLRSSQQAAIRKVPVDVIREIEEALRTFLKQKEEDDKADMEHQNGHQAQHDNSTQPFSFPGIEISILKEKLDWRDDSMRTKMFGKLEEALSNNRIPQIFYQPNTVFLKDTLRPMICHSFADSQKPVAVFLNEQRGGSSSSTAPRNNTSSDNANIKSGTSNIVKKGTGYNDVPDRAEGQSGPIRNGTTKRLSTADDDKKAAQEGTRNAITAEIDPAAHFDFVAGKNLDGKLQVQQLSLNLYSEASKNAHLQPLFFVPCFEELCLLILRKIKEPFNKGKLFDRLVLPLILQCKYRVSDVNYALQKEIFWSYDGPCEILFRTFEGQQQHPDPMPESALPAYLSQQILREIKQSGASIKVSMITQKLNWNRKSELNKAHGMFKNVLQKMQPVFYDPYRLYLKSTIDPLVEWPSSRAGRLFVPNSTVNERENGCKEQILEYSKRAEHSGDMSSEIVLKRQIIGWVMARGGKVFKQELEEFLQRINVPDLQTAFSPPYDLQKLLINMESRCFLRRKETKVFVDNTKFQNLVKTDQEVQNLLSSDSNSDNEQQKAITAGKISKEVKVGILEILQENGGTLTIEELLEKTVEKNILEKQLTTEMIAFTLERMEEVLYKPGIVYLQAALDSVVEDYPGFTCKHLHWGSPAVVSSSAEAGTAGTANKVVASGAPEPSSGATTTAGQQQQQNASLKRRSGEENEETHAGAAKQAKKTTTEGEKENSEDLGLGIQIRIVGTTTATMPGSVVRKPQMQQQRLSTSAVAPPSSSSRKNLPAGLPEWVREGSLVTYQEREHDEVGDQHQSSANKQRFPAVIIDTQVAADNADENNGVSAVQQTALLTSSDASFRVRIRLLQHDQDNNNSPLTSEKTCAVSELLPQIPQKNDKVLIVSGQNRHQIGTLISLERGTQQNATTVGIVELLGKRYVTLPIQHFVAYYNYAEG